MSTKISTRSWIAKSYCMCIFSFSRLCQIVFASGYTNLFSQQCMKVPFVPHRYQHSALSWSFLFCHHSRYVVMSPCHFNLHFLLTVSHMLILHLDILCDLLLLDCLFFLLTYRSSLYIQGMSPLSDICIANIYSLASLFTLMLYYDKQWLNFNTILKSGGGDYSFYLWFI